LSKSKILSHSRSDQILIWTLRGCAVVAGAIVVLIVVFLGLEALPVVQHVGLLRFFTDASWNPAEGLYNLTPMLWGTLLAMAGSVLVATPLGILSAVFCHYYAPPAIAWTLSTAHRVVGGNSLSCLRVLGFGRTGAADSDASNRRERAYWLALPSSRL
jgi:ABC-type phosphate transport system permease subunit